MVPLSNKETRTVEPRKNARRPNLAAAALFAEDRKHAQNIMRWSLASTGLPVYRGKKLGVRHPRQRAGVPAEGRAATAGRGQEQADGEPSTIAPAHHSFVISTYRAPAPPRTYIAAQARRSGQIVHASAQ